jgi:hypothetical protein
MELEKLLVIVAFILTLMLGVHNLWVIEGASTSAQCGDNICHISEENAGNCLQDCYGICGDCICEATEKFECPTDCDDECKIAPVDSYERQIFFANLFMIITISGLFSFYIWSNHRRW